MNRAKPAGQETDVEIVTSWMGGSFKQAFEWGFEQGFRQGFERGRREIQIEIVQRMLTGNFSIEAIAHATGLTIEQIHQVGSKITPS